MKQQPNFNRRSFLKGMGAAIALPMFETLAPTRLLASGVGVSASGAPVRMAYLFVPNGVNLAEWTPSSTGANFELPAILEPLNPYKRDLNILSGLTQDKGRANGDGPGDHARSAAAFLTGAQPLKSEGSQIHVGVSVDQFCAQRIKDETKLPSLEIGGEAGRQAGKCDSGYSCAYSNNISWRDETTPMVKETNPRLVFERLFGGGSAAERGESWARRERYRKSILDFVLDDAKKLGNNVSGNDRRKLDEYLTAVRDIERRVERAEEFNKRSEAVLKGVEKPTGSPSDYGENLRLLGDMMVLAFQADVTRVCTYMLANEGSNRPYRDIGISEGHHSISHHQNDPKKLAWIAQINRFHVEQLAYVLGRLKSIPEGDGSLLDNCMIVYGAGISDGNRHNNENLPILVAGKGGGSFRTGRHIAYPQETPLNNLYLSLLDRMGTPAQRLGDSTGRLVGLEG